MRQLVLQFSRRSGSGLPGWGSWSVRLLGSTDYVGEVILSVGWPPVRPVAPVFVAASIVVIAAVAASERGWVWAVVAWMGSSAASFAISVVVTNRHALTNEEDERQLLQAALDQKSESGVRSSSGCSIPFTDPPDTAAACASGGPDGELCVQVEGGGRLGGSDPVCGSPDP
jgi:hypothetical protein